MTVFTKEQYEAEAKKWGDRLDDVSKKLGLMYAEIAADRMSDNDSRLKVAQMQVVYFRQRRNHAAEEAMFAD